MAFPNRTSIRWVFLIVSLFSLILSSAVSAQTATPIQIGENITGTLTDPALPTSFTVEVGAPQSINVQVLAITPELAPTFRVLDPGGIVILDTANPGTQTIAQGAPNLASVGTYTIEVTSANQTTGQFLISVQAGAPLASAQPLALGQPVSGTVSPQATRQAYSFPASATDVLLLTVSSADPGANPVVTLRDADSGDTLGLSSADLAGVRYRIPTGQRNYLLEVNHNGSGSSEAYSLCLETESGSVTCAGGSPAATQAGALPSPTLAPATSSVFTPVQIDPNGACMVASASGAVINVRGGPGTNFPVVTKLAPTQAAVVIGRMPDNSWFEININGITGWVSTTVVIVGGNCSGVAAVQMATPVPPTNAPTSAPNQPTPTEAPTSNGTPVIHLPPIGRLTLIAPIQIVPVNPKLDYQASANYGEANLSAGFSPDPYSVGMTTGGNVDVSYLGGSCSGFATSHPDLRINFGGGGASLLRIYFVGANGDPAMVVNDPYGNFYCVDDSFGTVNPTIDFNNPAGGSYDVWVASHAANTTISGTLYLTENSGNHP